ncbi:unnamed protein product [Didymodactylos carnosus]|uniref:Uncharacterized protein n=1 Tax=Didymodactylos carnosus TaxID=1234261 RepID=A0A814DL09_9BILA|nr:unnamed protein product [Didymodactylos carnosus]CAF1456044.1 unnamed protein product [Didymodactylos carnosus]CAF3730614.1 unnamed protein product [Didymodactylos carnosus]CAF4250101.1 unnamed protein product [Didymodactylos carnosus]
MTTISIAHEQALQITSLENIITVIILLRMSHQEISIIIPNAQDTDIQPVSVLLPLKRSLTSNDGENYQQSKKLVVEIEQNSLIIHKFYLQLKQSYEHGKLTFDDDYIEIMLLLLNNCSYLQKLRLKKLFFEEDI